jgi:hypothetical protein
MVSFLESMITKKRDLLRDVVGNPSKYKENDYLHASLKSQGALASFEDVKLGIKKCSLNTFKTASKECLPGGFKEIDELRLNAKSKLDSPQEEVSENTKTIVGARRKSERLQKELNQVREQNFLLSIIIKEMKSKMKELAESSRSVAARREVYQLFDENLEHKLSYSLRKDKPSSEF